MEESQGKRNRRKKRRDWRKRSEGGGRETVEQIRDRKRRVGGEKEGGKNY